MKKKLKVIDPTAANVIKPEIAELAVVSVFDSIRSWNFVDVAPGMHYRILIADHENNLDTAVSFHLTDNPWDKYVRESKNPFGRIKCWTRLVRKKSDGVNKYGMALFVLKTSCGVIIDLESQMVKDDELSFRASE